MGRRKDSTESGSASNESGTCWDPSGGLGWSAQRREERERDALRELRRTREGRVASTTTYIERSDDLSVVIRGMFGGPGRAEDKRLAKAKAKELHCRSEAEAAAEARKKLSIVASSRGFLSGLRLLGKVFWVGCCPPLPSPVIRKILFQPPDEPLYAFRERGGKTIEQGHLGDHIGQRLEVIWPLKERLGMGKGSVGVGAGADVGEVVGLGIPRGEGRSGALAAIHFPCPGARLLFLYSHGNAMDLGLSIPFASKLRRKLNCAVLAYDYSGYGLSDGESTEESLYSDVVQVAAFAQLLGWAPEKTVALGFSLGTAATAYLASRSPQLAAVVLAGAFISVLNCLRSQPKPQHALRRFDKLRTFETVPMIRQPTLLIHGLEDQITPFQHALWILERIVKPLQPLFLPDTGHNDLDKPMLWSRLRQMVEWELSMGHPYPSLRALFARLLRQQVRGIHSACTRSAQLCRPCQAALARLYFDERRCSIVNLSPDFAQESRCLQWDVEPSAGDEGGVWIARFTLTVYTPLQSAAELRSLANRSRIPLPLPPSAHEGSSFDDDDTG